MDFSNITYENIMSYLISNSLRILFALFGLWIGFKLVNFLFRRIERRLKGKTIDKTITDFSVNIGKIAFKVILVISLATYIGIPTTSFVAVLGAMSFAIGLALQGSFQNFAGGVLIIILRPFKIDDLIDVNNNLGKVDSIGIFYTKLMTLDNKLVVVPNSMIINNTLTNYSNNDTRRIEVTVGVAYGTDVDYVKEIIREIVQSNEMLLAEPEPIIGLADFASSSINFDIKVYVKTTDFLLARYRLREDIKRVFNRKNIEFPFPHMDVNIYKSIMNKGDD
ncbi:MAG: mechanosensitive ion channel family protein [Bacillota bacterium]